MVLKLPEKIRSFRKQRSLTQEQLAEVLGVTVGAVYKWEAGLSVPELAMLVELADFFDTSVDVLLGYEMKDNRLEAAVQRLKEYRHNKDAAGLPEAEKALKKYPNTFEVVYNSGVLYQMLGLERHDKRLLSRALELLKASVRLLSQNEDPKISELSICGNLAETYIALGEEEQAVDLLRRNNAGGLYSGLIGLTLASGCGRPPGGSRALPFGRAAGRSCLPGPGDYGICQRLFRTEGLCVRADAPAVGNRRFCGTP